jgi:hypothetical protein
MIEQAVLAEYEKVVSGSGPVASENQKANSVTDRAANNSNFSNR